MGVITSRTNDSSSSWNTRSPASEEKTSNTKTFKKELEILRKLNPNRDGLLKFFQALLATDEKPTHAHFPAMRLFFPGGQFKTALRSFLVSHNFAVYNGAKGRMTKLTDEGKAFMQEYMSQNSGAKTVVRTATDLQEIVASIVGEIIMRKLKSDTKEYRSRDALTRLLVDEIEGDTQERTSNLTAQQVRKSCKTILMTLASEEGMNLQEAWPTEFPPESQTSDQTPPPTQDPNP